MGILMNKPPPSEGLAIRIPSIILIKGRGFINQGSTLATKPVVCDGVEMVKAAADAAVVLVW